MGTELVVNSVLQVRLEYLDVNGSVAYNVLHYLYDEVGDPATGTPMSTVGPALAQNFFSDYLSSWNEGASAQCRLTGVTVTNISPGERSRAYTFTAGTGEPGDVSGDMLPLQDTFTLLKRTAAGTRRGLGRAYIPGIPESSAANGRLSTSGVTWANQIAAFLRDSFVFPAGANSVVIRPILFQPVPGGIGIRRPIDDVQLSNNIIKTQRRRRPGKGI